MVCNMCKYVIYYSECGQKMYDLYAKTDDKMGKEQMFCVNLFNFLYMNCIQ